MSSSPPRRRIVPVHLIPSTVEEIDPVSDWHEEESEEPLSSREPVILSDERRDLGLVTAGELLAPAG